MPSPHAKAIKIHSFRETTCQSCSLRGLCLPISLNFQDIEKLDSIINRSSPHHKGGYLFRQGDPFKSLFAVRSGCVKTVTLSSDGEEQITGFYYPSELVGLSGIESGVYPISAMAIESTTVCEVPFSKFEELSGSIAGLNRQLVNAMSREIRFDSHMMMVLSKKSAEERVANFLLDLSSRLQARGFAPELVHLAMSRNELANYLGLAVETVSRIFSRLQSTNVINGKGRDIEIVDINALVNSAGSCVVTNPDLGDNTRAS